MSSISSNISAGTYTTSFATGNTGSTSISLNNFNILYVSNYKTRLNGTSTSYTFQKGLPLISPKYEFGCNLSTVIKDGSFNVGYYTNLLIGICEVNVSDSIISNSEFSFDMLNSPATNSVRPWVNLFPNKAWCIFDLKNGVGNVRRYSDVNKTSMISSTITFNKVAKGIKSFSIKNYDLLLFSLTVVYDDDAIEVLINNDQNLNGFSTNHNIFVGYNLGISSGVDFTYTDIILTPILN